MRKDPRKRLFVDSKVQGHLLVRILVYWFFSMIAATLVLVWWNVARGPLEPAANGFGWGSSWGQYGAMAIIVSVFILPALSVDTVLTSNRFVGPVIRLRTAIRALAAGERVQPIDFRRDDLWQGIAQDFNALLVYVEILKTQAQHPTNGSIVEPMNQAELEAATLR